MLPPGDFGAWKDLDGFRRVPACEHRLWDTSIGQYDVYRQMEGWTVFFTAWDSRRFGERVGPIGHEVIGTGLRNLASALKTAQRHYIGRVGIFDEPFETNPKRNYHLMYKKSSDVYIIVDDDSSRTWEVPSLELGNYLCGDKRDRVAGYAHRFPGEWIAFQSDQIDRIIFDEPFETNPYSGNLTHAEAAELFARAPKQYRTTRVYEDRPVPPETIFDPERTERVEVGEKRVLAPEYMHRRLGGHTWLEKRNGDYAVKLYNTDIVTIHPDGTYTIQTGGWNTVTTRSRINEILHPLGLVVWNRRVRTGTRIVPSEHVFARGRRLAEYETDLWVHRWDGKNMVPTVPVGTGVRVDAAGQKQPWLHRVTRMGSSYYRNPQSNVDRAYTRWSESMKLRKRWPFRRPPPHPMHTAQEIARMERLGPAETRRFYALAREALS